MIKQVLTGSSVLALLLISYLPARAQTQTPVPKPQGQQAPQTQVSSQELQKFANAVKLLLPIEQEARQQIVQVLKQEGLTETRFNEIYKLQQTSQSQPTTRISPQEEQKFAQALVKVTDIQQQVQPKMKKIVQDQGLEEQRFNQILAAVQQNPDLRQQVQKLIRS